MLRLGEIQRHFNGTVRLYTHYESIVRNPVFTERQKSSEAYRSLETLRYALSSQLSISLCALWDFSTDFESVESYPALLRLAERSDVLEALRSGALRSGVPTEPRESLKLAYRLVGKIKRSDRFKSTKNTRDKVFAHKLSQTRAERRGEEFDLPQHRDLDLLFVCTLWIQRHIETKLFPRRGHWREPHKDFREETKQMWLSLNSKLKFRWDAKS
ncbi:MAG: hypothetical protein AAGD13_04855 [Pseudomonadota bacterium]